MMRSQFLLGAFSLFTAFQASAAGNATTITSVGCVAPSDFDSCLINAANAQTQCSVETVGNIVASGGCAIGYLIDKMGCYYESCWNKVYSCEYQALVSEYQGDRDLVIPEDVPFWPAPDNAPGGCSCNMGYLYRNLSTIASYAYSTCSSTNLGILNVTAMKQCDCCLWSAATSAYYGICPDSDPDEIGASESLGLIGQWESNQSVNCSEVQDLANCEADYGISSPDNGKYLDQAVGLPPTGTQPLSTTAGPLTSPPGGATFTYTLFSQIFTATAAPYNKDNVEITDGSATSGGSKATSIPGTKATSAASDGVSGTGSSATSSAVKSGDASKAQSPSSLCCAAFALLAIKAFF